MIGKRIILVPVVLSIMKKDKISTKMTISRLAFFASSSDGLPQEILLITPTPLTGSGWLTGMPLFRRINTTSLLFLLFLALSFQESNINFKDRLSTLKWPNNNMGLKGYMTRQNCTKPLFGISLRWTPYILGSTEKFNFDTQVHSGIADQGGWTGHRGTKPRWL